MFQFAYYSETERNLQIGAGSSPITGAYVWSDVNTKSTVICTSTSYTPWKIFLYPDTKPVGIVDRFIRAATQQDLAAIGIILPLPTIAISTVKICDCGAIKANTTHSHWCSTNGEKL